MIKFLSDEDKAKIVNYIKTYASAYSEDCEYTRTRRDVPMGSLEHILRFWSQNKEDLFHLFGDKFIIELDAEVEKAETELIDQMREVIAYGNQSIDIRNKNIIPAAYNFYNEIRKRISDSDSEIYGALSPILNFTNMVRNTYPYSGNTFNGSKLQKGMKLTKIYEKAAQYFGIEGFEDFRLAHSLVLNNKKSTGKICLSIHPLDYMTMSDNQSSWTSCMSWIGDGCYRQGTVEMMNSKYVVVAYLKSDEDVGYNKDLIWNNKKWRQLFVVSPEIITGVRQYPFCNDKLSRICLDALKNLFEKGTYSDNCLEMEDENESQSYDCYFNGEKVEYKDISFSFNCGYMYSDFPSVSNFPVYLGKGLGNYSNYTIEYSGESECMWCGNTSWLDSDTLLCSDCYIEEDDDDYSYCENCGDRVYYGDMYTLDDENFCEYCYNEYAVETINGYGWENHNRDNCTSFVIVKEDGSLHEVINEYHSRAYYYVYESLDDFNSLIKRFNEIGVRYALPNSYNSTSPTFTRGSLAGVTTYLRDSEAVRKFLEDYELETEETYYTSRTINWYETKDLI